MKSDEGPLFYSISDQEFPIMHFFPLPGAFPCFLAAAGAFWHAVHPPRLPAIQLKLLRITPQCPPTAPNFILRRAGPYTVSKKISRSARFTLWQTDVAHSRALLLYMAAGGRGHFGSLIYSIADQYYRELPGASSSSV